MSSVVKFGPPWNRTVIDSSRRVITYGFRTKVAFGDIKKLTVLEYITRKEEEELLNIHPEVQKDRRPAELWIETKDGRNLMVGEEEQAGLLLATVADAARAMGVPLASERSMLATTDGLGGPRKA